MAKSSKLIEDLTQVPNIIGRLGLSIAAAQKAFDLNYLENLEKLIALIKMMESQAPGNGPEANVNSFLKDMLIALAPSRYQFSETTLTVRLDLAQSMNIGGTVGLGVGYGGIAINAAFTLGYRFDYRAAAECHTVIHATLLDPQALNVLMKAAKEIDPNALKLPKLSEVDKAIFEQTSKTFENVFKSKALQVTEEK